MSLEENRFRDAVIRGLRIQAEQYRADLKIGDIDEWDSVAHLDLLSEIEAEFERKFSLDEMSELTSLDAIRLRLGV